MAAFLKEYAASTQYVNENVSEAAQLVAQYDIVEAAVAEKAIPYCNIVCITGEEMKSSVQGYFQVLFDQNPQSVGGACQVTTSITWASNGPPQEFQKGSLL